jgi:small subunit ribosomal protein S11
MWSAPSRVKGLRKTEHFREPLRNRQDRAEKKESHPYGKTNSEEIETKDAQRVVHIQASFNNTIITITTLRGEVISWSSAGACGFRGARKGTPCRQDGGWNGCQAIDDARNATGTGHGKGAGPGRDTAIRGLQEAGLRVKLIRDITPFRITAAVRQRNGASNFPQRREGRENSESTWKKKGDLMVLCLELRVERDGSIYGRYRVGSFKRGTG